MCECRPITGHIIRIKLPQLYLVIDEYDLYHIYKFSPSLIISFLIVYWLEKGILRILVGHVLGDVTLSCSNSKLDNVYCTILFHRMYNDCDTYTLYIIIHVKRLEMCTNNLQPSLWTTVKDYLEMLVLAIMLGQNHQIIFLVCIYKSALEEYHLNGLWDVSMWYIITILYTRWCYHYVHH
jgi:hypothetical protein